MGNGALAIGPKLPRPSSTLPPKLPLAVRDGSANRWPLRARNVLNARIRQPVHFATIGNSEDLKPELRK